MSGAKDDITPKPQELPARPAHSGWAVLVGLLGIVFIFIGAMLVAMLQAPVVRSRVIVTGFVLIGCGLVLVPVAWRRRNLRPRDQHRWFGNDRPEVRR